MDASQVHPDVDKYVRQISANTKYPIHNFRQLVEALGGENGPIEFEGWQAPAGRLRQFVPDHYFPVVSEQDLTNKAEDLRARHMGMPSPATDAPPQAEEEMPESLRADFRQFSQRGLDLARIAPPSGTAAAGGVARFPEGSGG